MKQSDQKSGLRAITWHFALAVLLLPTSPVPADGRISAGSQFTARDTLNCGTDSSADARQCLEGLSWPPSEFPVICENPVAESGDWLVRFPSPVPHRGEGSDRVAMEWYAARNPHNSIMSAPAVVVVHESGRGMTVGRIIAKGLRAQGFHAFLLHLPGYGARRVAPDTPIQQMLPALRQAIADVRRARDAVVALPSVDDRVVGLQGTSLGGFVTATVAGLDSGYDRVFILLAGGNLHEVIRNGARDAAEIRRRLAHRIAPHGGRRFCRNWSQFTGLRRIPCRQAVDTCYTPGREC